METLRGAQCPTFSRLQKPVLVLNASYEPINICAARRALVLVLKGIASAEEVSTHAVHSARAHRARALRDPAARIPPHPAPDPRPLAQEHPDARPLHLPVLPSKVLPAGELTLDHVIPRSRAGESAWENLVACCHPCNNRKGSRTPEEAGMKLARQPRPFSLHTSRHLMRLLGKSDEQWRKYLFY